MMTDETGRSLEQRIAALEQKIDLVVSRLGLASIVQSAKPSPQVYQPAPQSAKPASSVPSASKPSVQPRVFSSEPPRESSSAGQLLGYAGIACLFLATILLVRLSIDSGWLTPVRQLGLACAFGAALIVIPFIKQFELRSYISQLPALGVVVFHLTIYAGVFIHHLIEPDTALILVSAVSVLSLVLLEKFNYAAYALISIFGTYAGALFLKSGFNSSLEFFGFILLWNITYCVYAIVREERKVILITSYLAIGLVSLKVWSMPVLEIGYVQVAIAQMIQFLVFLAAVGAYSTVRKTPLKHAEAMSFFPLVLFFYGLEYHLFDRINPQYATIFALFFAASIFGVYKFVRHYRNELLESADVTYMIVASVLAHSIFFVLFSDELKICTPFIFLLLGMAMHKVDFGQPRFRGAIAVCALVTIVAIGMLITGSDSISKEFLVFIGSIYGAIALLVYTGFQDRLKKSPLENATLFGLVFAHSQILLAIYRMGTVFIDRSFVAPAWIVYAFVILAIGKQMRDPFAAQTALPIIVLGLIRFLLVDFSRLDSGARIIALLVMGSLIFVGGYLYKKTLESAAKK